MNEKKLSSIGKKCKSCGGNLAFSPKEKGLICEFCQNVEKVDYDKSTQKHEYFVGVENQNSNKNFDGESKVFKCSNCGANIVLNSLEVAKRCPYCGSSYVAKQNEISGLKPDAIIPFKYTKEQAKLLYKQEIKKKWFLPNEFKKKPPTDNISGIYVPSFSYDAQTKTKYDGRLARTDSRVVNGRTESHTTYFNISGNYDMNFVDVLVETSAHITQDIFSQLKPFNKNELVKYNSDFILGYSVEQYNTSLDNCKKVANSIMERTIKQQILSKYSYSSVASFKQNTVYANEKYQYCIMPIYQVKYNYKNKDYITYMNGQTGKVAGDVPKSKVKISLLVVFILLIVIGIGLLVYLT